MEPKDIPFRSPKRLTEEEFEAVFNRSNETHDSFQIDHTNRQWNRLFESKAGLKLLLQVGNSPALRALICMCLQIGFDLHAKFGDAGTAAVYVTEEKALQDRFREEHKPKGEDS